MNKTLKTKIIISLILIFVFSLIGNCSFAVIDMNLASNIEDYPTLSDDMENMDYTEDTDTNIDADYDDNTNNTFSEPLTTNSVENTASTTSTKVSTLNSLPESELGLTNILNILLITIGVILILLGIAIIIKLKDA